MTPPARPAESAEQRTALGDLAVSLLDDKIARFQAQNPGAFQDETEAAWFEALACRQREQQPRSNRQREQIIILARGIGATAETVIDPTMAPTQSHAEAIRDGIQDGRS